MKYHDYYSALGVSRDADDATIKKAYRKLAREFHPDVNKSPGAEARFKEISEAYEVLGDPAKRKRYDALGANWQGGQDFNFNGRGQAPGGGFRQSYSRGGANPFENFKFDSFAGMGGGSGFSDFFESLFGGASFGSGPEGSRQGSSRRASGKGVDHESEITISLEDACSGAVKPLTLTAEGEDGSLVKNSFELKLPKGTRDGAKIKVPGKGGPSRRGGSSGDLYLRVHIAPHPIFKVVGNDLEEELPISPAEAVLGAEVDVKTLGGSSRIRIRPGTQSGQRIRLKGKGMPGHKGEADGDLYAVARIVVPESPEPAELELYKKLAEISKFKPRGR